MLVKTSRLVLKPISWDDLEELHQLHSLPEVDEFNTLGIPSDISVTRKLLETMIAAGNEEPITKLSWSIRRVEDNAFAGEAGMILSANRFRRGEIYYNLLPSYWGHGYATEVARELIRMGFEDLDLHRIEAGVAIENFRSIHVLEKAGMTREGQRRKILPIRGEWKDNYHYAILETDPR